MTLAKMYNDYKAAKASAKERMESNLALLDDSDPLHGKKRDDIERLYENEIETLKKDFNTSLAKNKQFSKVVKLRNMLMNYLSDREAALVILNKEFEEDGSGLYQVYLEQFKAPFEHKWDGKFIELIRQNPDFLEYPGYLFEEVYEDIKVVTSSDGLLRYYSWDIKSDKGSADVASFRQYRTNDGSVLVSWEQRDKDSDWVGDDRVIGIHVLEYENTKYYLVEKWHSSLFTSYYAFHIESISDTRIIHPHLFHLPDSDQDDLVLELNTQYNDFLKDEWVAKYDEDTRTIYVRKYKDKENHILSDGYITYLYNDGQFVRSYAEKIDLIINNVISYIEVGIHYRVVDSVFFDNPREDFEQILKEDKYSLCDRSLIEDMLDRIEKKEPVAQILYRGAAEKGDKIAQFKLGNCLYKGYMGVSKNAGEAKEWFEKAASQDHWLAKQQLGLYFGDQRYDKDSPWFTQNLTEAEKTADELREFIKENENTKSQSQRLWEWFLVVFIREHPRTLDCGGKVMEQILGEDFKVVTSRDGRVRTYCWTANPEESKQVTCCIHQFRTDEDKVRVTWNFEQTEEEKEISEDDSSEYEDDDLAQAYYEDKLPWEGKDMVTDIKGMDTAKGRIYLFDSVSNADCLNGAQKRTTSAAIINEGKLFLIPIFMVDGKKKSSMTWETDEKESWINNLSIED